MAEQLLQFGFSGFVVGCIYAIAASGLVLTYTTTGIFNFAHGAIGGFCAFAYWWLTVEHGIWPPLGLVIVVLAVAPAIGLLLEAAVFRRFRTAPVETTLVVSIALTLFVLGITNQLFDVRVGRRLPPLIGSGSFEVIGVVISYDQVAFLVIAIACAVGLRSLLFHSRLGATMRAVVDSPELVGLTGARASTAARASWMLGVSLASVSGILIASGRPLQSIVLTFLVVNAYSAAVVGRLKSLPATFAGAIALGMLVDLTNVENLWGAGDVWNRLRLAIPAMFLFVAMLALPVARLRTGAARSRSRPPVPTGRASAIRAAAALGAAVVLAPVLPAAFLVEGARAAVIGVVMLSLVLVTGYAGQINLASYAFMAVGASVMGSFLADAGTNPIGLLLAALIAAPLGTLVALPTIRLQGLYVALASFAFALLAKEMIVGDSRILGLNPRPVGRPALGPVDLGSDAGFFVFACAAFAAVALAVLAIRRGRLGRRLAALNDSEAACATLGIDVRWPKLVVFTLSAAIAGLGGAMFGSLSVVVTDIQFDPIQNLVIFLYAVVGGITTVTGAALGAILFVGFAYAQAEYGTGLSGLVFAGVGVAAIALGRQPDGLAGYLRSRVAELLRPRPGERSETTRPSVPAIAGSGDA